jgi:hypothetical protein
MVVEMHAETLATSGLPIAFAPRARHGTRLNDRVSAADGRVGSVIGFFRRDPETVLVLFDSGGSGELAPADLQRLF